MARPRTNVVIKKSKIENLINVWTLAPAKAKRLIEAIEGVNRVHHFPPDDDQLDVWLNPCYDKAEIEAEIRAALFDHQRDRVDWRPKERKWWPCPHSKKTIGNMRVGETGYIVPWALDGWTGPDTLNGLNLSYPVHTEEFGTADTLICRTETGWVVGGRVFPEKAQKAFGGTIAAMRPGEAGYVISRAIEGDEVDKRYTVFREGIPAADVHICRTNDGWVVGGKVFKEPD